MVIGAVLVAGAKAPKIVTRDIVASMRPGSVIVDVAVDQGGCIETSRPTTHSDPTYVEEGVVHYCVANIPGAVARTSTLALTSVTLPYLIKIADKGIEGAPPGTRLSPKVSLPCGESSSPSRWPKARPAPRGPRKVTRLMLEDLWGREGYVLLGRTEGGVPGYLSYGVEEGEVVCLFESVIEAEQFYTHWRARIPGEGWGAVQLEPTALYKGAAKLRPRLRQPPTNSGRYRAPVHRRRLRPRAARKGVGPGPGSLTGPIAGYVAFTTSGRRKSYFRLTKWGTSLIQYVP